MDEPTVGSLVFTMRKHRGLTQEELAEMAYTTREYISQLENDKASIDAIVLLNIGRALKCEFIMVHALGINAHTMHQVAV